MKHRYHSFHADSQDSWNLVLHLNLGITNTILYITISSLVPDQFLFLILFPVPILCSNITFLCVLAVHIAFLCSDLNSVIVPVPNAMFSDSYI